MPPPEPNILRFVIRENGGLVLGKVVGCERLKSIKPFKSNTIYEIVEIMGEFMVREVGPSNIQDPKDGNPLNWGQDAGSIIQEGRHLYTQREAEMLSNRNLAPNLLK